MPSALVGRGGGLVGRGGGWLGAGAGVIPIVVWVPLWTGGPGYEEKKTRPTDPAWDKLYRQPARHDGVSEPAEAWAEASSTSAFVPGSRAKPVRRVYSTVLAEAVALPLRYRARTVEPVAVAEAESTSAFVRARVFESEERVALVECHAESRDYYLDIVKLRASDQRMIAYLFEIPELLLR